MAVRTTEEILESIKTRVGDSTEDADLEFLEDVTDTLSDLRSKTERDKRRIRNAENI